MVSACSISSKGSRKLLKHSRLSLRAGCFGSKMCGAVPSAIETFHSGRMTASNESGSEEQAISCMDGQCGANNSAIRRMNEDFPQPGPPLMMKVCHCGSPQSSWSKRETNPCGELAPRKKQIGAVSNMNKPPCKITSRLISKL